MTIVLVVIGLLLLGDVCSFQISHLGGHSGFQRLGMVSKSKSIMKKPRWTAEEREVAKEAEEAFDDDGAHGGSSGSSGGRAGGGDAWDVLVDRLDSSKGRKNNVGKVKVDQDTSVPYELQCVHYDTCSGCSRRGDYANTPMALRAQRFFASEDVDMKIHTGPVAGWRTHVKLAVRPLSRWGGLKFGLYKANSHDVEPIPECRVHHPRINEAAEILRLAATDAGVIGYEHGQNARGQRPTRSSGELRYVQFSLERHTNKVQVVLVWNAGEYKHAEQSLPRLMKRLKARPDLFHSVTMNFNPADSNNIFNYKTDAWKLLWGPPMLKETIGSATFLFRPQVFRQANLDAFESGIVPLVAANVPSGSRVSELYSGIGVLGLNVCEVSDAAEVLCTDSNGFVDEIFDRAADSLSEQNREKVFFENREARDAVQMGALEEAQVVIVDPPRKGLDEAVMSVLLGQSENSAAKDLRRLIYVSCGYEALERDSRRLLDSCKWTLRSADGFVLFPGSDHVETVAVFDKSASTMLKEDRGKPEPCT